MDHFTKLTYEYHKQQGEIYDLPFNVVFINVAFCVGKINKMWQHKYSW